MPRQGAQSYDDEQGRDLVREVQELVNRGDLESARALLAEVPPADVADILESVDAVDRVSLFELLDSSTAGAVLGEVGPLSVSSLADSAPGSLAEAVEEMEPDEQADVLDVLSEVQRASVLRSLPAEEAHEVEGLLEHAADTAGGIMTPEFVLLAGKITASEAVQITQRSRESETIAHLFVSDKQDRLVGHLPLHRLVFARADRRLAELMEPELVTVTPDTDREEVVRVATKYDLQVVPVVDEGEKLVGVITIDDVLEAAQDEADEDMYRLAGTAERDPVHASVLRSARLRLPWLLLTLVGGIGIAFLVSRFGSALSSTHGLAFFIPLIPLMGGNVAIQASTIVVRGLAVGDIRAGRLRVFMLKQWIVSCFLAVLCGAATALLASLVPGMRGQLEFVVAAAVCAAIVVAGSLGTVLPLAFHRAGVDPAVSAGPFVTILNDLICITIYLTLGTIFA